MAEGVEELGAEEHLLFVDTLFQSEVASEEPRVTFYILELMRRHSNDNKLCAIEREQALNSTMCINLIRRSHFSWNSVLTL